MGWKKGKSGNPKGRIPRGQSLREILQVAGETTVLVGGESLTAKQLLARAIWQLVTTGEVTLAGRRLQAESVSEWANAVKWLMPYIEDKTKQEVPAEFVVKVVRVSEVDYEHGVEDEDAPSLPAGDH